MRPMGLSASQLARELGVSTRRITAIVRGASSISAELALRLGTYFGVSPETWLGLHLEYDLRTARREHGAEIERRVRAWSVA